MNTVEIKVQVLQLIGLLLPVVVLVLRAYLSTYDDLSFNSVSSLSDQRMVKAGSLAAIVSILALMTSGIMILGSVFTRNNSLDILIFRMSIVCLIISFAGIGIVVLLWLKQVISMAKVKINL